MGEEKSLNQPRVISKFAFGVRPDKVGEIVVLMERDRTEQYKGAFDEVLHELRGGTYSGITGLVENKEVSAIYSKGPSDIADCVAFLGMSKTKCHTILSTGSIGGLGEEVDVGDFVIVNEAIGNDGYSLFNSRQKGKNINGIFENIICPSGDVSDLIEDSVRMAAKAYGVSCHIGKIFTIPGVSLENYDLLIQMLQNGCIAVDMETAQFFAACKNQGFNSAAIHWVTDLPLTRNFFHNFHHPEEGRRDWDKKSPIWLNMAKIITDILRGYINKKKGERSY